MTDPKTVLRDVAQYLRKNPDLVWRTAVNAAALKVTVPLDAVRTLLGRVRGGKKAPRDVVIGAEPPALRASAAIRVTSLEVGPESVRLALKLADVSLKVQGES
ncbi:MAG TPA: hypothetical protein VFS00_07015, partial [Polyangiaceae bacterium]|nr:hypothetical protein [Polyangiaceae bacterium]